MSRRIPMQKSRWKRNQHSLNKEEFQRTTTPAFVKPRRAECRRFILLCRKHVFLFLLALFGGASVPASRSGRSAPFFNSRPAMIDTASERNLPADRGIGFNFK